MIRVWLLVLELRGKSHINDLIHNCLSPLCSCCLHSSISALMDILNLQLAFCMCVCAVISVMSESCLTLCDPTTVARQVPLPMGPSRQEY